MSSPNIITWNFTNWLTIVLMALLGFVGVRLLLGAAANIANKAVE